MHAAAGAMSERLVVGAGNGIQNAFVWVKDGLGTRTYAVPTTPVMLDQKGCQYIPHVLGVQVGQTVKVANSDAAMHNVHSMPKANREFNFSQPANVPPVDRVFTQAEIGLPLKCDVHGWMRRLRQRGAASVLRGDRRRRHVRDQGLPPGTYTVEVWHETLGTQSQSVTVDGKTPAALTVVFKPATS